MEWVLVAFAVLGSNEKMDVLGHMTPYGILRHMTPYGILRTRVGEQTMPTEQDRFRAFAEQYVVSRAPSFKPGDEQQGGWQAALDAKTIYDTIVSVSQKYVPPTVPSPPAAQSNNRLDWPGRDEWTLP